SFCGAAQSARPAANARWLPLVLSEFDAVGRCPGHGLEILTGDLLKALRHLSRKRVRDKGSGLTSLTSNETSRSRLAPKYQRSQACPLLPSATSSAKTAQCAVPSEPN